MNLLKHYPHISVLLLVSIFLSLIGVYAFVLTVAFESSSERRDIRVIRKAANDSDTSVAKLPVSSGRNNSDSPSPVSVIKQIGTAKATHYAYSDNTISQTEYMLLRKVGNSEFMMVAYFEEEGYTLSKPDNISLRMVVMSEDFRFASNRTFKIFLNGKLAFSKENEIEASEKDNGIVTTSLMQDVPYSLFVKMSHANKVRFQIGATSFELKESNIESFRDLVALVEPETTRKADKAPYPVTVEDDVPPIRKSVTTVVRPSH